MADPEKAVGREMPDDPSLGEDGLEFHENATTPLDELERVVDREFKDAVSGDVDLQPHSPDPTQENLPLEAREEEAPAEEPEGEAEADAEPAEATADDEPAEDEADPDENGRTSEPDRLETLLRMSELARQKTDAEMERLRLRADRDAGRVGHLQKRRGQIESRPADDADEGIEPAERAAPRAPSPEQQEIKDEIREIRSERAQRALEAEARSIYGDIAQFRKEQVELLGEEQGNKSADAVWGKFSEIVKGKQPEYEDEIGTGDHKMVAASARSLFRASFVEAQMSHLRSQLKQAVENKQARRAKLRASKKEAGVTGSKGSARTLEKRKGEVDPVNDPLDKLEAWLDEQFGVEQGAGNFDEIL